MKRTVEQLDKILRTFVRRLINGWCGDRRLDKMLVSVYDTMNNQKPTGSQKFDKPLWNIKNGTWPLRIEPLVTVLRNINIL